MQVKMKNICKSFSGVYANENINLAVEKGEIHALLGENGSGKTTLMNMIAGIYYPDSGSILINGEEVTLPARQVLSIAGGLQNVVLPTTTMKIMNNLIVIKD